MQVAAISIVITIDGKAVAKGRGRHAVVNGHAKVFTPAHTRSYENRIKDAAADAMGDRDPLLTAVEVFVEVVLAYPKSMSEKKKLENPYPLTKPDIDNYIKSALDGINTIVIHDDNQVVLIHGQKRFGGKPAMTIVVKEIMEKSKAEYVKRKTLEEMI